MSFGVGLELVSFDILTGKRAAIRWHLHTHTHLIPSSTLSGLLGDPRSYGTF